jgi:hypothetical protein
VLIDALCDWTYECCTDGERDSLLGPHFGDAQDCKDRMAIFLNNNDNNPDDAAEANLTLIDGLLVDLAYEVDLSRSEPIAEGITACLEELEKRECNDDPNADDGACQPYGEDPCALDKLFMGKVAVGGECNGDLRGPDRDIECVTGSSCEDTDSGDEDVFKCVAKGLEGALCNPSANDDEAEGPCEYGFYCAPDGRCATLPTLGESCAFGESDEPHVTDWLALYATGVDPDDAFDTFKGNESIPCEVGLNCDPLSLKCVKWCDEGANCAAPDADDDWAGSTGSLSSLGYDAANCADGLSCIPHEFSTNVGDFYFQCGEPGASAGDICDDDGDCASSLYCHGMDAGTDKSGTCKARIAEGKECDPEQTQCGANYFCGACGLLATRNTGDGDLEADPLLGDCDSNEDDVIDGDDTDGVFVCQPVLPISIAEDQICAGTDLGGLTDDVAYDEATCKSGSWCAYTNKLSNGDAVTAGYHCVSKELGSNVECLSNQVPYGLYDSSAEVFYGTNFTSNQDEDRPWSNSCANGYLCYDPADTTQTCRAGVAAGQPCDYDTGTESKGHCAMDLHCVNGTCQAFLMPGDPCDKDSNDWDAGDDDVVVNGFEEKRCDPFSSSCQQVHGGYYCEVFNTETYVRNYCVEGGGSN